MAAVAVQAQDMIWQHGSAWCFTSFNYNATGETVAVPPGVIAAAVYTNTGTAPTATTTAGLGGDSVALTGGTTNRYMTLVTKHSGNPASVR